MAEEEEKTLLSVCIEKDDTSQSKDVYIPEESAGDVSISLLDIQMPETPESTKGQISDGDTSRLESPKMIKPVLGKVQAKKRLMAFTKKFNVLPKVKTNLSQHSPGALKTKDKVVQEDTNTKSRKKPEEKILAIEEIRREESKSKMLLAEAMAAASIEDENQIGKHISGSVESLRHTKEKNRHNRLSDSCRDTIKSTMDRKYSERRRQRNRTERDNSNREVKDRNESADRLPRRSSQDKEKHKKDKKKKVDRDKRDNSKADTSRDRKEEGKDKKESEKEKREDTKEKKNETKSKKENTRDKRNDISEVDAENKDKKEKCKDNRSKEKEFMKCNSWAEIRKCGLDFSDIMQFKRRDNTERSLRNRTGQDYTRYFEQMLMLSNYRLKRQSLVAEGLDGPKKYPPESIKITKRTRGPQVLYCENPRASLLLNISQLLSIVTPDRREKIRDICEATSSRIKTEDSDVIIDKRNWYQQIDKDTKYDNDAKWQVQLPKSKWDSEEEGTSSTIVTKEGIEKPINKLHVSLSQQENPPTPSDVTDEDKVDNNVENNKDDNGESSEKTTDNMTTNDEASTSSLRLESAGEEKLASEYEQFMKMVSDIPVPTSSVAEVATKEYSPKTKSISPRSYHEFNIESNVEENRASIEIFEKEKFEEKDKLHEGSIKSTEGEVSIVSPDYQIQINENSIRDEHTSDNHGTDDTKSIPSDWENVRIKVERLSDENTDSREVKKKKKKKKEKKVISSSDSVSSDSVSSSDVEKEKKKKKKKRKRKMPNNSSSSDSDSTDSSSSSSSSSSDSSSSDEKRKRKRKKKVGKKRKKARRAARTKKKRRRKMSSDSSSSESDERTKKKKKKAKKKAKEPKQFDTKSVNNGDINKVISKSPVITSPSVVPVKNIKEEVTIENTRAEQVTPIRKNINARDNECAKQKKDKKESKSVENFMEEWEMDSMIATQQNEADMSSRDRIEELEKIDDSEKDKHRRKRKQNRDDVKQDKDRSSKSGEGGKEQLDEEVEIKRKRRREKDVRSSTEFLTDWEKESERITHRIQNETKYPKKSEKQKKEKWRETDFDTLNVPSLTQLEKEVCRKQLLADEWEVDSLEAIPDLTTSKRKSLSTSKKIEKEVKYVKKTDTYIAVEKETTKEKKRQERFCAIRIWEEEQEEGEREEMMLLEQKNKRKRDDWDIEEESFLKKSDEEIEIRKVDEIIKAEKVWNKLDEGTSVRQDASKPIMKLEPVSSKRVKKSRWDMGSQSEEKLEVKDIWEEDYVEWSSLKCEQKLEKTEKETPRRADHSESSSSKSDLIDFYRRKPQNRESLERSWTSEEVASRSVQAKKAEENSSTKNLITVTTSEEQTASTKKEHPTRDHFKNILELDVKFKEKTIELYSPSSPALSQKSQDVEASNDSSSSNSSLRKKTRNEMLIVEELPIPTTDMLLQLTKLRDTKHPADENIENVLDTQLERKVSPHKFDIKEVNNLFDDLPMNEPCLNVHGSKSALMDIFAEYESEGSRDKQPRVSSVTAKDDEPNEEKTAALKLIPKQLLIRRSNEQVKPKHVLETPLQDPVQHAAALLTIQKKLLESHALKSDNKEPVKYSTASNSETLITDKILDRNEFDVAPKSSVIEYRRSKSPVSEKPVSARSEQSESYNQESKNINTKKYKSSRNLNDTSAQSGVRSPVREQKKKSSSKKESEKRYSQDYSKDRKERKSNDAEKSDRRDNRGFKPDITDSRRRTSSPLRSKRKKSGSPYTSWERQGSGNGSPGHSWSRSCSRSPKRKDESVGSSSTRDREKKRDRYDDERSNRSRMDERRERHTRSSPRSSYDEDNFKKHSSKNNRDDWDRRRHDNIDRDREKDTRSYDPIDMLRERTIEEKYRDNRFHAEGEVDRTFWQYETGNLRDGNESMDSYVVTQDAPAILPEYDDRPYYREGSLERDIRQCSPQLTTRYRRRYSQNRSSARRERQWEDKESSGLDRHGYLVHRLDKPRSRTPPRLRLSPARQLGRFRRQSRSRSRTWSRSRSRTRSRSRSRSRSTSRSRPRRARSRSRSRSNSRSRARSSSASKLRSPEHGLRMLELHSSKSPSPGRDRFHEIEKERKDESESRKHACGERGRRIETIVQSGANVLDSEMGMSSSIDGSVASFQYSNEIESRNEYYYTENNLTYPPCMDESSTSSPKRLSLDDRLELELGIKKQQNKDSTGISSEYSSNFNSNVIAYPSPPQQQQQQQQQMMYRQQPTVLQVGNVLQVVPADFNGVQSVRREVSASGSTSTVRGSSQVVRVGNVLQVVPTSLDWSGSSGNSSGGNSGSAGSVQSSSNTDQSSGVLYSSAVPAPSPSSSMPMSIPVPVPVPMPVPPATGVPAATMSPAASLPLALPVPVPVPVPIPTAATTFPARNEPQPQKIAQPVYNYEAILETRRKEREERKRLRELRRKEKERRRIERTNRRALRLLEKNNTLTRQAAGVSLDRRKGSVVDPSVLKALRESEEQSEETESPSANAAKDEEESMVAPVTVPTEEDEDAAADEDEDEDEDEAEAEIEDDEEEEEEAEDEEEDDEDDDEKTTQVIIQRAAEVDEIATATYADTSKSQVEIENKECFELPPPPLKGILVTSGFRDTVSNGNVDDLSDADGNIEDGSDKDEEIDKDNEHDKDASVDDKLNISKPRSKSRSKLARQLKKKNKKSVQFADGIKPGEGTSPSGGEGDMPSPPPPTAINFRDELKDLKRDKIYSSRKSRKQEKRVRPPKAKKKVKVKIIKLKKPRITPLTAMMMDDSDELDDRSPPPPPPGSPPPPHLWPSYLSAYNTAVRAAEPPPQTTAPTLTPVQAPPPPTPLPLLVPPPPLNYTIQPCSKA